MNIPDFLKGFKSLILRDDVFTIALILLVGAASFGLGRASVSGDPLMRGDGAGVILRESGDRGTGDTGKTGVLPLRTAINEEPETTDAEADGSVPEGGYVASKSGTKYHFPWCSGAKSIKEENKIWFATKEEAELAGYTPAANCKGI